MTDFVPGSIANDKGDLFGTTPLRVIQFGRVVVDASRARHTEGTDARERLRSQ